MRLLDGPETGGGEFGLLLTWEWTAVSGADDMKTEFDYDNLGRLIKLTDPEDNETEWEYDFAGRVIEEKIAKTTEGPYNTTLYGYNPDGQIAYIEDPLDQTFEYDYDDSNWLSSITMTDTAQTETVKTILYSWNTGDKTMLWTVGGRQ